MRWPTVVLLSLLFGCGSKSESSTAGAKPIAGVDEQVEAPPTSAPPSPTVEARAEALAKSIIILDGHIDVPWRLEKSSKDGVSTEDVGAATDSGDFDLPRARAGGLDAPFMSIYVSPDFEMNGADAVAERLIASVEGIVAKHPDDFALAPSVQSVRNNFKAGRISLPMGMENGAPLMGKLENVARFHERGIRYITLAHSKDNHISDSSYDDRHTHGGLSAFGKTVVAEMNRVGIMVDVSHISDEAFWDVIELSKVPVIASHSSCRHFTPGFERNMSDEMIRALAKAGGVIQINFGSGFLDGEVREARKAYDVALDAYLKVKGLDPDSDEGEAAAKAYAAENPAPRSTVAKVADHVEHVIGLVGVEHVGLGSDFDGVGDSLPEGLRSVADYPNLFAELLRRGRTEAELEKIASGNVLRVWRAAEAFAAEHPAGG
ncbi:MAG: dipeptidase [Nannocystaceae bacterium]|nr:dipeptidase [bacterium]